MRRRAVHTRGREPTIALINIVFLMLVFFMVAGTLTQPLEGPLQLISTRDLDGAGPPDALVIHADGTLSYRGDPVASAPEFVSALAAEHRQSVRLVPDRDLAAQTLVDIGRALQDAGAGQVLIVTERGLE